MHQGCVRGLQLGSLRAKEHSVARIGRGRGTIIKVDGAELKPYSMTKFSDGGFKKSDWGEAVDTSSRMENGPDWAGRHQ